MATYAIGDIQGCFDFLQKLLDTLQFDPTKDTLWFTGDLVNRGHQSLATLRFIKALAQTKHAITVLGNHDLHLLAVAEGVRAHKEKDTFQDVLTAPDAKDLLDWLRHQPLLHHDPLLNYTLVHAGIPPQWTLADAHYHHDTLIQALRGDDYKTLLKNMYDTEAKAKQNTMTINYFTRMRFCTVKGELDLQHKGGLDEQSPGYYPWFRVPNRANQELRILFGHWAALQGKIQDKNIFPLDTGCIWGNCLTAMRLEDQQHFSIPCAEEGSSLNYPSLTF